MEQLKGLGYTDSKKGLWCRIEGRAAWGKMGRAAVAGNSLGTVSVQVYMNQAAQVQGGGKENFFSSSVGHRITPKGSQHYVVPGWSGTGEDAADKRSIQPCSLPVLAGAARLVALSTYVREDH